MQMLKTLRWPLAILAATALTAGTLTALNPRWVRIEHIEIELVQDSKEELLFQRIKTTLSQQFKEFEGKYFWEVPLGKVFSITSKDKRVKMASVFREFPSKLRIQIEPRTPVLTFLGRDGKLYPIATDATLLPALSIGDAPDLPILRGEDIGDKQELRELALELLAQVPPDGLLSASTLSEIVYTRKDGFKLFINKTPVELKIGDSDFGPKISRVQKVLAYMDARGIKGRVIDARYSKKVVVRARNTP